MMLCETIGPRMVLGQLQAPTDSSSFILGFGVILLIILTLALLRTVVRLCKGSHPITTEGATRQDQDTECRSLEGSMIEFNCPICGKSHKVHGRHAGRDGKCACGTVVHIPHIGTKFTSANEAATIAELEACKTRTTVPPAQERSAIMWITVLLGAATIFGAILPGFDRVRDVNSLGWRLVSDWSLFESLGDDRAPFLFKFLVLYPILAGPAIIFLALAKPRFWRSLAIGVIGLVPFMVAGMVPEIRRDFDRLLHDGHHEHILTLVLAFSGWLGMFWGALLLRPNHRYRRGAIIAAIGGSLYLLYAILPLGERGLSSMPILRPFLGFAREWSQRSGQPGLTWLMLAGLLAMIRSPMAIAVASLSVLSLRRPLLAVRASSFVLWAIPVSVLLWMGHVVAMGIFDVVRMEIVAETLEAFIRTLNTLKMFLWWGSLLFLVPIGIANCVLIKDQRPHSQPG